ncbi:MAG: MoaD/ThiS family protein [Elusimicrobia bacterium]|nr:MoaD/ThiS family protein [Elusimicrobiota bacterium]
MGVKTLKLLFFAQCADWIKKREMELSLEKPTCLKNLVGSLPDLSPIFEHADILRVSVNREFTDWNAEVKNGDEVAFLPPVSGG